MSNLADTGKPLQIRDVPDDVLDALRDKAEAEGTSLAAYALEVLIRDAVRPSVADVLASTAARLYDAHAPKLSGDEVADLIRADRGPLAG